MVIHSMAKLVRGRHRPVFRFIKNLQKEKCPHSPMGNKDRKNFCGTTLFAEKSATSARCQHTVCP